MTTLRNVIINTAMVVVSVAVGLTVVEIAARLYLLGSVSVQSAHYIRLRQPDPTLGWKLKPNLDVWLRTIDYSVRFQTNSKGFNDVEHSYQRSADDIRIVVLGDSFMEAYQVPRQDSFVFQLSNALSGKLDGKTPEVINLGVGGFGTTQEYLMLKEEGARYEPDIVLLAWLPANDVRNNHRSLETIIWGTSERQKVRGRPFAVVSTDGSLTIAPPDSEFTAKRLSALKMGWEQQERRSTADVFLIWYYVERLLNRWIEQRIPKYDPNVTLGGYVKQFDPTLAKTKITEDEYERMWAEAESVTWKILKEMGTYSEELGARFCVFTVPTRFQVEQGYRERVARTYPTLKFDPKKLNRKFFGLADDENLCMIDLLPAFLAEYQSSGQPLHHKYEDRHWNARGHAVAARVVAEALISK